MKGYAILGVCAALFGVISAQVAPINRGVPGAPGQMPFNQFGTGLNQFGTGFNQFGMTGLNQFGTTGFNNPGVNQFGFTGMNQFGQFPNQFGMNQFGTTGFNSFNNPSMVPGGQMGGFAGASIPANFGQFGQFNQFGNRFGQVPGQIPGQIPGQFGAFPGQVNRFNTPVGKKK